MVNNEVFKDRVVKGVQELCGCNCKVSLQEVQKNNSVKYTGVTMRVEGENTCQIIYLEQYYELYRCGSSVESIVNDIVSIWKKRDIDIPVFDIEQFKNFENYKDKIVFKLVNYNCNEEWLKEVACKEYLDMAIVFYVLMDSYKNGKMTFVIHNTHLKLWDISIEELYKIALENSMKLLPCRMNLLLEVISELVGEDVLEHQEAYDKEMYVATNPLKNNGAAVILYPNVLKDLSENLNQNLVVLPSSVHESIIIPDNDNMKYSTIKSIVAEVNRSQVSEEEYLSDNIYYYDRELDKLSIINDEGNV